MKIQSFVSVSLLGVAATFAPLALIGCSHVKTAQKTGTEFNEAGTGKGKGTGPGSDTPTEYVTQEEYDRMTPEERLREHAEVGVTATLQFGSQKKPFSRDEFDSTMKKARDN